MANSLKIILKIGLLTAVLALLSQPHALAQTARASYQQAEQAYETGQYAESLAHLGTAERSLGGTNPRIQSLRTLNYYAQNDPVHALVELTRYFRGVPSEAQNTDAYKDMQALREELTARNKGYFEQQKQTLAQAQGQEIAALDIQIAHEKEEASFALVKESGSPQALNDFLRQYPSSAHRAEVRAGIGAVEKDMAFETLVAEGDAFRFAGRWQSALRPYTEALKLHDDRAVGRTLAQVRELRFLELLALGRGHAQARRWASAVAAYEEAAEIKAPPELLSALATARDEAAFAAAEQRDTVQGYEAYLTAYAAGLHALKADAILLKLFLDGAEQAYRQRQTDEVKRLLAAAAIRGENSLVWPTFSPQYYNVMHREAQRLTTGKKADRIKQVGGAIAYYQVLHAQASQPYGPELRHLLGKQKAWQGEDYSYFAYRRDLHNDIGFDFGMNNNLGWGGFVSIRGPWQGLIGDYEDDKPFDRKGRDHFQLLCSFNVSKKVIYPLWVYAGAGYAQFTAFEAVPNQPTRGFIPSKNVRAAGGINTEFGVLVNIRPVTFSLGVSAPQFSAANQQLLQLSGTPLILNAAIGYRY